MVSVTLLGGLEHLTDGSHALSCLGRLLARDDGIARDLGSQRPALRHRGQEPPREVGRPRSRAPGPHSAPALQRWLVRTGPGTWRSGQARGAQRGPGAQRPALSRRACRLGRELCHRSSWLRGIRDEAEPHATTTEFVWAVTAVDPDRMEEVPSPDGQGDVFLSIIMRTQGQRIQELREALLSLAGQTVTDFEGPGGRSPDDARGADEVRTGHSGAAGFPPGPDPASPAGPRRAVCSAQPRPGDARGRYISVFDDDDLVLSTWVVELAHAEREHAGCILRVRTVRQDVTTIDVHGLSGVQSTGPPEFCYSPHFSLFEHITANQSPPIGFVFPRSLHTDWSVVR